MDMVNIEPEQGASMAADLLPQDSHGGGSGCMPPTASYYGERLAAGVSTIRLQITRLSGAHWKKAYQSKENEGTCMVEKPPRKSSSKEAAVVRSRRGVKRPHSDSSTLPWAKQQPKKPRSMQEQAGSYKEAVVGIKMVIIHKHHP
jgi:hypothetical protein